MCDGDRDYPYRPCVPPKPTELPPTIEQLAIAFVHAEIASHETEHPRHWRRSGEAWRALRDAVLKLEGL